jgi:pimeloyl-ACP methyl ester carboxylesterase
MPNALVRKRCFVQMTGYEPVGPEHQHRRFIREMARFQKAWNLQGKVSPPKLSADGAVANWTVDTWGPNWRVTTDFHWFRWDDFVAADMAMSDWWRFPLGIAALMEFVLTGTVVRYFILAWRYGAFFLSPLVYIAGMMWLSIAATRFAVIHGGLPYRMLLAPLLWLAIFAGLRWTFGRMVHIGYALDDWYFARDLIHRARPQVHERLDRLARELVRLMRETDADEVIVDGHSLGAPLSLVVIDRALQLDPQLRTGTKPLHIVSTGSSLLKVALHPAAGWLREVVCRVANTPTVYWVEYQALVDIINVYKVDPVVALGLPPTGKPIVKIFRIRLMVEEHTYRRFHLNFLRIHRQAVMGNERRYFYDYYMLCCGPIPLVDRVANPEQAVAIFAADGALNSGGSVEVKQGSPATAGSFDK